MGASLSDPRVKFHHLATPEGGQICVFVAPFEILQDIVYNFGIFLDEHKERYICDLNVLFPRDMMCGFTIPRNHLGCVVVSILHTCQLVVTPGFSIEQIIAMGNREIELMQARKDAMVSFSSEGSDVSLSSEEMEDWVDPLDMFQREVTALVGLMTIHSSQS